MCKGLTVASVVTLALWGCQTRAYEVSWSLHELLSIGLSAPAHDLKWGLSKVDLQRSYPQLAAAPASGFPGFRLRGVLRSDGCQFDVYLRGGQSDQLALVGLEYKAGSLADCRSDLESTLDALYGPPTVSGRQARWTAVTAGATVSGPSVQSTWRSATTCLDLTSKGGTGYRGSPLILAVGDRKVECGYDDQVIPVHAPKGQ